MKGTIGWIAANKVKAWYVFCLVAGWVMGMLYGDSINLLLGIHL